jgi:hypothetical protein
MRIAYVDETGHSNKEKIAIVGGVVIEPDRQFEPLSAAVAELQNRVPSEFRDGFFFHAASLFFGGKFRDAWSDSDRWSLLDQLVALPRNLGIPLVFGSFNKPADRAIPNHFTDSVVVHAIAFGQCLKAIDIFMRENASSEVAMMVAEDRPEAQKAIKAVQILYKDPKKIEEVFPPELRVGLPITRIRPPPVSLRRKRKSFFRLPTHVPGSGSAFLMHQI